MASSQTRSLSVGACNAVIVARVSTVVPPSALRTSSASHPHPFVSGMTAVPPW